MRNADFFGRPIYFPDLESQPKQIQHIIGQFLQAGGVPFSVSNALELKSQGKSLPRSIAAGALGLTPENKALRQTPAQNFLDRQPHPATQPLSPDQVRRNQLLSQFENGLRQYQQGKVDIESVKAPIRAPMAQGLVTRQEVNQRIKDAGKRPFAVAVDRQPLPIAVQAWNIARKDRDPVSRQDEADAAEAIKAKVKSGALDRLPPDQLNAIRPLLREFRDEVILPERSAAGE
jgi:hypothetical protein